MKIILTALVFCFAPATFANDLGQAYEKAYFLETAKGQIEEALVIYRKIASIEATDENRESILLALARLQWHYEFPNTIPFKIGFAKFNNGDSIEILEIRGAKAPFEVGATYLVRGAYTLASRDRASIALYVTPKQRNSKTRTSGSEHVTLKKGTGRFELSVKFEHEGWPHLSLYPVPSGNAFGMMYFGTGEWLWTEPLQLDPPLQDKVDGFDMEGGSLDNVIRVFGEPQSYVYGQTTFAKDELPSIYVMLYPDQFTIFMNDNRVEEFRFEGSKAYEINGIKVGLALDEALTILGKPKQTIETDRIGWKENTLYLTTSGKWAGGAYIAKNGLRLFFRNEVLSSLYITDNTALK